MGLGSMDFQFDSVFNLEGKVALITGGAAGIGKSVAELFADRGANLVLFDRNPAVLDVAESLGGSHLGLVGDVSIEKDVIAAVDQAVETFSRIDILINNAGIGPLAAAEDTSVDLWDQTMAVNLRGAFLFARQVGKQMLSQKSGRVVNLASQAAIVGLDRHLAYCASKAGILGMTNVLAMEWGGRGITVNSISPTVVDTALGAGGSWSGEIGERFKQKVPVGRFAQPQEIAYAALYLVSGAAAMINGENIVVDGGYTAT